VTEAAAPGLRPQLHKLFSHSALYGAADVFTNLVNFLLVPLYTAFLSPRDYGDLALLLLFSTLAKILFRMGLDSAFFRIHYEMKDAAARRRLAGTIASFAALAGTALFGLVVATARPIASTLLGGPEGALLVVLAAADVYFGVFAFVPMNLLRIEERPGLFSLLSGGRHLVNTLLKVLLVMQGYGVTGVLLADAAASGLLSAALLPRLRRHAALALDARLLHECLRFALPKLPHGLLLQVQNLADRKILDLFVSRAEVGLYQVGYSFGLGVKFPLSAFEPAWQPFVYSQVGKADAARTLARVASVAWTSFVFVGVCLAVLSHELLVLMTPRSPAFRAAAPIIPVVVLAYLLQGFFLLTSVGIGISKQARYYPIVTLIAAITNVAANFALVPHYGILGAAWATVLSYAAMAGVGFALSRRLFPVPWRTARLAATSALGAGVYGLSLLAPAELAPGLALKGPLLIACALGLYALLRAPGAERSGPGVG
jgi:O-antigen/teichoic acid export membrane protein